MKFFFEITEQKQNSITYVVHKNKPIMHVILMLSPLLAAFMPELIFIFVGLMGLRWYESKNLLRPLISNKIIVKGISPLHFSQPREYWTEKPDHLAQYLEE